MKSIFKNYFLHVNIDQIFSPILLKKYNGTSYRRTQGEGNVDKTSLTRDRYEGEVHCKIRADTVLIILTLSRRYYYNAKNSSKFEKSPAV